jgi:hypothetical protein
MNLHFHLDRKSCNKNKKDTSINIAVVIFVKDDPDILPYWLDYHTALFGTAHIVVIDHDSQNDTLTTLKHWRTNTINESMLGALQDMWQTRKFTNQCWGLLHNYNSYPTQLNDTIETIKYFAPYQRHLTNSKKIIAKTPTFLGLDHGNHGPVITASNCSFCQGVNTVGLLHFHVALSR